MAHNREPSPIWTYAHEREPCFDVPTKPQLAEAWGRYHKASEIVPLDDGYYGICEMPDVQPSAVISLDLCEVVRQTARSLARIADKAVAHGQTGSEGDGYDYAADVNGWRLADRSAHGMFATTVQELMHHGYVPPVRYSGEIAAFMRRWRAHGVYTIANTSTSEGCEVSTIRFLSEAYPEATRGILLPRNHNGKGSVTKAAILTHALQKITDQTGFSFDTVPTLVLEDMPHHAVPFADTYNDVRVFMPEYPWNEHADEINGVTRVPRRFSGTLDTFIAADRYLAKRGIIV